MARGRAGTFQGLLAATLTLLSVVAVAQPAELAAVDPAIALPILMKVLTYDRNFASRSSGEFIVLVLKEQGKNSELDVPGLARTLKLVSVQSRPLKFVQVTFKDQAGLDAAVQTSRANALLAPPGCSEEGLVAISEVAQDNQIYTMALEGSMVEKNLAVGVGVSKEGRPQIVINLVASKAIGAVFDSSVLKLARVVQ